MIFLLILSKIMNESNHEGIDYSVIMLYYISFDSLIIYESWDETEAYSRT